MVEHSEMADQWKISIRQDFAELWGVNIYLTYYIPIALCISYSTYHNSVLHCLEIKSIMPLILEVESVCFLHIII